MPLRRSFLSRFALFSFVAVPLFAQTAPPPDAGNPAATLRVNARSVVVDVVVTDRNGKAITGLPKEDFQVFEDGKPQTLTFFEPHAGAPAIAPEALPSQAPPPLPPNTFTNVPAAVPSDSVNVLLMDALNTPMQDQTYVHKEMVKYLANIPPGIRIGVLLLSNRLRIVQGFTEDGAALRAAIARSAANPTESALLPVAGETNLIQTAVSEAASMGPSTGNSGAGAAAQGAASADSLQSFLDQQTQFEANERIEMTLEALQQIARYLAGIPERKNLVWFSSSIPLTLFATAAGNSAGTGTSNPSGDSPYYEKVKMTVNLLAKAQVSVYPIEAAGLAPDPIVDVSGPPITAMVSSGDAGTQGKLATQHQVTTMQTGTQDRNLNHATMDQLARDTGGKALYNLNSLSESLAEAIDNGARYYTVAYTPTNRSEDGKARKIEIKLTSGKYNLAYRRGYFADTPKELRAAETAAVKDPLRPLMDRGMPNFTELRYRINVTPANPQPAADAARAGNNAALKAPFTRYGVNFVLTTEGLSLDPGPDGVRHGKIEVALVAYSHDGKPLNWSVRFVGLAVKPEQYEMAQKSGIPFHLDIDAPPGDIYLRTGIFDMTASRAGTLEIPLNAITIAAK
ncbi:MAG: VWA domain-containing protein [Terracidiphilus sp.]